MEAGQAAYRRALLPAILLVVAAALLGGCGTRLHEAATTPAPAARATPAPDPFPPVYFRFLGLSDDRAYLHYQVYVNTTRPLAEVDIVVWEDDFPAQTGIYAWKNADPSGSVIHPIEPGKLYDVYDILYPNARATDARLQQVVYKDGAVWVAK
jgi:hypothetical protein